MSGQRFSDFLKIYIYFKFNEIRNETPELKVHYGRLLPFYVTDFKSKRPVLTKKKKLLRLV